MSVQHSGGPEPVREEAPLPGDPARVRAPRGRSAPDAAGTGAGGAGQTVPRRDGPEPDVIGHVRQDDIEPYTGLRWVGTVFKAAAVFLLVALAGEFVAGLRAQGVAYLPYLLGETARTFVFMVVLWGAGDLVRLLVDIGHDIRAQRIFLTRMEMRSREERARRARKATGSRPPPGGASSPPDRDRAPASSYP